MSVPETRPAGPLRLGVVVPCRDEARTIAARLADLARDPWPTPGRGEHLVVVVDDGSTDDTADVARRAGSALSARGVRLEVLAREGEPGKPAAIRTGLARLVAGGLSGERDLVVLTDADVVTEPGALGALARAFDAEPGLGMACGAQRYVGGRGAGLYDRAFALARRAESRCGALLSVHGQLLAWRASLELSPPDGKAADDLELVVRARDRHPAPAVRLVPEAVFVERRARDAGAQIERRARAWFQHFSGPAPARRPLRWQWLFWSLAPRAVSLSTWPLAPFSRSIAERRRLLVRARAAESARPLEPHWSVDRTDRRARIGAEGTGPLA